MQKVTIIIGADGNVFCIDSEAGRVIMESLGVTVTQRASHVRPYFWPLRWLFCVLRWAFGDEGRIAAWTRTWNCLWYVDASPVGLGRLDGVWRNRSDAIDAEVEAINEYFTNL